MSKRLLDSSKEKSLSLLDDGYEKDQYTFVKVSSNGEVNCLLYNLKLKTNNFSIEYCILNKI